MKDRFEKLQVYLQDHPRIWLITGAAGFIGSHLVEHLLHLNQHVIGIDNFATGFKKNIDDVVNTSAAFAKQFQFVEMDIEDLDACRSIMQGVDYVLHHAAMISVPESIERPMFTNAVNITGFLNILCAARDANIRRLVYASSSAVYGDVEMVPTKEQDVKTPLSPYGVSKFVNELYARSLGKCYQMETIGLRYFNVFGPRQNPNGAYAAVIPRWINALLKGQTVQVFGDGETSRDFCYINNIVQANLLAALVSEKEALNQVYNIATGYEVTLNKLLKVLQNASALKGLRVEYQAFRPGDIRRSIADISKAQRLLGYQPRYDLQKGLAEAMAWYRQD